MTKKTQKKITSETTLEKILKYSQAEKILVKYKLPCLGCPMAVYEMGILKVGQVAKMYNIDLKNLLKELNAVIGSKKHS
ncbi:MAG: DUF1858 domain-containing protein [Candidatus Portnoybacteria bacterium]|nr:DUF1858 domain-containing protein [Candidatus Portnoybacteria bacterium]